jgi:hypothetical protein
MAPTIQRILIFAAIILLTGVLAPNVYNSIIDAQNWGSAIPQSLDAAKAYFAHANPGHYYRTASPAAQIAAFIALMATWPAGKRVRILAASAFVLAVLGDVFTFAYFFPRNDIMFGPGQHSVEVLREAWSGWNAMNWVRSAICFAAVICELSVLSLFESRNAEIKLRGELK